MFLLQNKHRHICSLFTITLGPLGQWLFEYQCPRESTGSAAVGEHPSPPGMPCTLFIVVRTEPGQGLAVEAGPGSREAGQQAELSARDL